MWKSTGGSASMCSLNSCERIRPERARNPIQRLVWGPGAQFQVGYPGVLEEELSCNPRVALRRLLRLYEGRQYREAATFLQRLPRYTLKSTLPDIPIDLIVESLPHSLSLLEAVYSRLLDLLESEEASRINDESSVSPGLYASASYWSSILGKIEHQVLWRVVHHISITENSRDAGIWGKLLVTLSRLSPGTKKLLASRRRSLERAVEGLGKHGLVASNTAVGDQRWRSTTRRSLFVNGNTHSAGVSHRSNTRRDNNETRLDPAPSRQRADTSIVIGNTAINPKSTGNGATVQIPSVSTVAPPATLLPLTAKLRDELETRLEAYKLALHKIESWGKQCGAGYGVGAAVGVTGTRSKAGDRQVRAASHQRQLSLKYSEVQQRLIDNQSLLNALGKPSDHNLEDLIGELRRRVERDKEALRQWNAVRKSSGLSTGAGSFVTAKNPALAASLLQFSRACSLALRIINEATNPSGYQDIGHRSKEHGKLREDNRFEESSSSAGYHTDDSCSPTPEPVVIPRTAVKTASKGNDNGDIVLEDATPESRSWTTEQLTDRYVALYAHAHLHTLDALNALEPLKDATDLKAKILFSVVVLSWRVAEIVQASRRLEAMRVLNGGATESSSAIFRSSSTLNSTVKSDSSPFEESTIRDGGNKELENCSSAFTVTMNRQIARYGHESGTRQVAERVLSQLVRTLYDFPCLRDSVELKRYANACSSLAWICLARESPLVLDVAQGLARFDNEIHARHRASPDPQGSRIVSVIWPGLFARDTTSNTCLYRAIVLTSASISPRSVNRDEYE